MMNKKKFGAAVLAGMMMFGMGTSAFAAEIPDVNNNGKVNITKDFEMADGLETPNVTFSFEAKSTTPDAPTATVENVSYTKDDKGTLKDGKYVISKNAAISFGQWKHAGEYVYTVKETQGSESGVSYSAAEYTLRVYVINTDNGLAVEKITAQGKDGKTDKILFTNVYAKNNASLTIIKNTDGKYADKTKKFDFEITFTKSPTSDQTTFTGHIGNQEVVCEAGKAMSFKLSDKEQLVFNNLPVGTTYVVTEKGVNGDGYTPSITVIENGKQTVAQSGNETDDLSSLNQNKNNLVGENENKVTFVNNYQDIAITGIVMNNLPFILLIGVAVLAFGALVVMKKRRTFER